MNSRVKIALLVLILAAITAPLKFIEPADDVDDVRVAVAQIERFLEPISEMPLHEAALLTTESNWTGWHFSLDGCEADAFPSPADGWLLERARARAGPHERVSLIYQGRLYDAPPVLTNARNVIADRLLSPLGLIKRPDRIMVLVIAPANCADKIENLRWPASLQPAQH